MVWKHVGERDVWTSSNTLLLPWFNSWKWMDGDILKSRLLLRLSDIANYQKFQSLNLIWLKFRNRILFLVFHPNLMCSKCPLSVSSENRTISTEQFRDSRPVYSTCTLAGVHFCPQLKQLHLFGVKLLHQNPFSLTRLPFLTEEKKQKNKTDSEPKSMKVESVYLKQCFKLLLLQSQVGKKTKLSLLSLYLKISYCQVWKTLSL